MPSGVAPTALTVRADPGPPGAAAVPSAATAADRGPGVGLALWAAVVVVAGAWGTGWVAGAAVGIRAAPLMGRWDLHAGAGLVPAAAVGALVVLWGPTAAARVPWRTLPPAAAAAAVAWTTALGASDGWARLTEPLTTRHEYEPLAGSIGDVGEFVRTYVDRLGERPIHVQGHPPGPVVAAWLLDRAGLGGAGWLAALAIGAWGAAVAAALVAARLVAGEAWARRAAPVLVVLPAAVWAGTSLDALFAGVAAVGIAAAAVAGARSSPGWAALAGTVLGLGLLLTYGAVLLVGLAVVAAIGGWRGPIGTAGSRRAGLRVVGVPLVGGILAVLGLAAVAGFWWPDGLDATRHAYWAGIASRRPALYLTAVGNPAALALATGPAVAFGLGGLCALLPRPADRREASRPPARDRVAAALAVAHKPWLLPAAAAAALAAANASQYARGEVERIWLPFVPWLALAAPGDRRVWLAAQVALAVALEATLRSPW